MIDFDARVASVFFEKTRYRFPHLIPEISRRAFPFLKRSVPPLLLRTKALWLFLIRYLSSMFFHYFEMCNYEY